MSGDPAGETQPFDPDAPALAGSLFGLPCTAAEAAIVLLPVAWQATTSYRRGTREGPAAILAASTQVDLFDREYGELWRAGIAMLPDDGAFAALDAQAEASALAVIADATGEALMSEEDRAAALAEVNALSAEVDARVYAEIIALLDQGKIPGVVGGDHSSPFGAIRAVAERYPGIGVLHIDAHADLRQAYEGFERSHASVFYNVLKEIPGVAKLVQVGLRDVGAAEEALQRTDARIAAFYDAVIGARLADGEAWGKICDEIVAALPAKVYVSFDIDGLDPTLCPGTGTPVPGGLSFRDLCVLLNKLSKRRRIVGFDLNEIGPGEWDGVVGARALYKLCGAALRSRG